MLSTTLRGARPLRPHTQILAIGRRTQQQYAPLTTQTRSLARPRPAVGTKLLSHPALRNQMSTKPPLQPNKIDKNLEKEIGQKEIEARPDEVSTSSTVRHVIEQSQAPPEDHPDVMVGLKSDINTVKETFALKTVPREAYTLGLAGTLPYLATSLSTVWLSWNLNTQVPTKSILLNSFLFDHDAARYWLLVLEPIQIGYGAVIISFLGAIHWGLEFAEKQSLRDRTRLRYAIGVLAPAVAWPTIFLPTEWALTTQFAAFCALYFADSSATVKGWAPPWYATYRFVLTAVVGAALLVSLVGRAKTGEGHTRLSTAELKDRIKGRPGTEEFRNWAKEEAEERKRIQEEKRKKEEEEEKKKGKKDKGKKEGGEAAEQGEKGESDDSGAEKQEEGGDKDEDKQDNEDGDKSEQKDVKSRDDPKQKEKQYSDDSKQKEQEGGDESKQQEKKGGDKKGSGDADKGGKKK